MAAAPAKMRILITIDAISSSLGIDHRCCCLDARDSSLVSEMKGFGVQEDGVELSSLLGREKRKLDWLLVCSRRGAAEIG